MKQLGKDLVQASSILILLIFKITYLKKKLFFLCFEHYFQILYVLYFFSLFNITFINLTVSLTKNLLLEKEKKKKKL